MSTSTRTSLDERAVADAARRASPGRPSPQRPGNPPAVRSSGSVEAASPGAYAAHRTLIEACEERGWTFRVSAGGDYVAERFSIDSHGRPCSRIRLDPDLGALVAYIANTKERN